ncbi:MAG: hypothetical protein MZV63_71900 [Marinilabiliales bacterium]|nr:hypothetical protein [Marinilabiliales bacterium]
MAQAFCHFAADSAVILRGRHIIRGREAIKDYYKDPETRNQAAVDAGLCGCVR